MTCYVTHLECANCFERYAANQAHGFVREMPKAACWCAATTWMRSVADFAKRDLGRARRPTMWRYRELVAHSQDSEKHRLARGNRDAAPAGAAVLRRRSGMRGTLCEDESRLPTGSFQRRAAVWAMAITKARDFGGPSSWAAGPPPGNAGGAMAAYGRPRPGMGVLRIHARRTPPDHQRHRSAGWRGAKTFLRSNGLINELRPEIVRGRERRKKGWFDLGHVEGAVSNRRARKPWGLELAEQLDWAVAGRPFCIRLGGRQGGSSACGRRSPSSSNFGLVEVVRASHE